MNPRTAPRNEGDLRSDQQTSTRLNRRVFIAAGITGFILVCSSARLLRTSRARRVPVLDMNTILLRNPAFLKTKKSKRALLQTRTAKSEAIVYEVDDKGELAFDLVVNLREYYAGVRRTLREILTLIQQKFPETDADQLKTDFLNFIAAGRKSGIFMTENQTVWSVFVEG